MKNIYALIFNILLGACLLSSCSSSETKKEETTPAKKDTVVKEEKTEKPELPKKAPIINITDSVSVKRTVIVMKDSAASEDRIGMKLGIIYGEKLGAFIKKNDLKVTGQPMAWYKTEKAPFFFEAGVPVEKAPAKLGKGMMIKQIGVDSVIIAHFYGPYELTSQAYTAVKDILKDRKKKAINQPYEIYVDDPMDSTGKMKDPYKVQTDIVFPWK